MLVSSICSRETIIIEKERTVLYAAKLMLNYNVGSIVVVETDDKGNKPIGIITDRDIVLKVVANEKWDENASIEQVMSKKLLTVKDSDSVYDALNHMREKIVRRIPVVDDDDYLVGILTIEDVMSFFSMEINDMIRLFRKEQSK